MRVCVCARRIVVHGEPFLRAIKPFSAKVFDLGAEFKMSRSEVTDHMTPHIYWSHLIGLIKHNHSLPEAFGSVRVCYSLYSYSSCPAGQTLLSVFSVGYDHLLIMLTFGCL